MINLKQLFADRHHLFQTCLACLYRLKTWIKVIFKQDFLPKNFLPVLWVFSATSSMSSAMEKQVPVIVFVTRILLYVYVKRNLVLVNFDWTRWYLRENKMVSDKANNYWVTNIWLLHFGDLFVEKQLKNLF